MTNRGWWDGYFDETFVDIYRDFLTPERTEREIQGLRLIQSHREHGPAGRVQFRPAPAIHPPY